MPYEPLRTTISRSQVVTDFSVDTEFTEVPMWLDVYVTTAGSLVLRLQGDSHDITLNLAAGNHEKYYRATHIRAASTMAGQVIGCLQ